MRPWPLVILFACLLPLPLGGLDVDPGTPPFRIAAPEALRPAEAGEAAVPEVPGGRYTWAISGGTLLDGAGSPHVTFQAGGRGRLVLNVLVLDASGLPKHDARIVVVR